MREQRLGVAARDLGGGFGDGGVEVHRASGSTRPITAETRGGGTL
jgi:hypothetical protein